MKHGIFFFSLYLLTLAFVPCQDDSNLVAHEASAAVHAYHSEHEHHDSNDHEDHCTPFCSCACCGAVLDAPPTLLGLAEVVPLPPKGNTQPVSTRNLTPGSFAAGSWQPPRV